MPGEFQFVQGTKHYVDRLDDLTWGDVGHCRLQFPSQCFSETKFPDFGVERERKREAAESRLFRALRVIGESLSCDSLQAMNVGDKYVTGAATDTAMPGECGNGLPIQLATDFHAFQTAIYIAVDRIGRRNANRGVKRSSSNTRHVSSTSPLTVLAHFGRVGLSRTAASPRDRLSRLSAEDLAN